MTDLDSFVNDRSDNAKIKEEKKWRPDAKNFFSPPSALLMVCMPYMSPRGDNLDPQPAQKRTLSDRVIQSSVH